MKTAKLLLQIDDLLDKTTELNVSEILPKVYALAKSVNDEAFEQWVLLETSGYFDTNPAMTDEVMVPEYRKVPGLYHDKFGRPLVLGNPDLFKIINHYHLREGAAELELLSLKDGMMSFRNPFVMNKLQEMFGVEVDQFHFKTMSVIPILHEIRSKVIAKLIEIRKRLTETALTVGISPDTPVELAALHPIVQNVAGELYKNGHYRQAILDTYIALVDAVKVKSARYDLDNTPLMQTAFSPKSPIIRVSNDNDEQQGFMWLFSGAIMAIRNPKAHRLIEQKDPQRALEWLSFASVLFRVIDDSQVIGGNL